MKYFNGLANKISKILLLCLFGVLSISTASASLIIASGDSTPAFYAADSDNNVFFSNILGSGTSVLAHELSNSIIGGNLSSYYDGLAGVSSTYLDNSSITAGMLSGVDLFVTGLREGGFDASEMSALNSFVDSGGSVMFMGEYTYAFNDINDALAGIGSSMSLFGANIDIGTHYAGVAVDPLTSGVSEYQYGATYGVSGGTALFYDSTERVMTAYERTSVPESSTLLLLGFSLLGFVLISKKRQIS